MEMIMVKGELKKQVMIMMKDVFTQCEEIEKMTADQKKAR